MKFKIRFILWRILGLDYKKVLQVHDYVFLKNDPKTSVGFKTYDNGALVFRWSEAPIEIGKFCSIANDVRFIVDEAFHSASAITSFPLLVNLFKNEVQSKYNLNKKEILENIHQKAGIKIGNDVWIGMGAYLMPGITIGNGATIAANSVVTKDVPPFSVVGGVPAKVIKMKHPPKIIEELERIKWWDWELEYIKSRIQDFYGDLDLFVKKY